ncbi:glutaredoxin family protein [Brucella ciceri]|uniref:glutaredoxin-like protein NrdH n=1 Tax=Brucella ciceri TaxID=391287 RepID=UPI000DE235CC|nr:MULTISPECIES: glutaredoxin-like protein NrdH [Brucella]MCH6206274.1 glutaredoxin family protein [Brucella ciceri]
MITVYTKPGCVQCNAAKRYLERHGATFEMVDVTADQDAYDYLVELGHRQLPVIKSGNHLFGGFKPEELLKLAEKQKAGGMNP